MKTILITVSVILLAVLMSFSESTNKGKPDFITKLLAAMLFIMVWWLGYLTGLSN